jgi:hypothetical protein
MSKEIPLLERVLPAGQIVNRGWLYERGISRPRVDYALRAGKLEPLAHGYYRLPGPPLKWEHVVYSLNEMGYNVHVSSRSALELQGHAHYLPVGDVNRLDLFVENKLPAWVLDFSGGYRFVQHRRRLFENVPAEAIILQPFGAWDWPIPYAAVELAFLELLAGVETAADFSLADKFFESAVNLRPSMLHSLLHSCKQVKAKRLFLWFSERHNHDWLSVLDINDIDLGAGKRMIVKGGALNSKYQITVPKEMASESGSVRY